MSLIVCPKCGTETDPRKQACELCGKFIILTELSTKDQKTYRDLWNQGEIEIQKRGISDDQEDEKIEPETPKDTLAEMGPLSFSEFEDVSSENQPRSSVLFPGDESDGEEDKEEVEGEDKKDLLKKSKLLKHIQEEQELFGDLED